MSLTESLSKIIHLQETELKPQVKHERKVVIFDQQREIRAIQAQHEAREKHIDLELKKAHLEHEAELKKAEERIPNTDDWGA